jgi:hypothetical protein
MTELAVRRLRTLWPALLIGAAAWLALRHGLDAELLRESGGIDKQDEEGVEPLIRMLNALESPAIAVGSAIVSLGVIGAGIALAIGSHRAGGTLGKVIAGAAVLATAGALAA